MEKLLLNADFRRTRQRLLTEFFQSGKDNAFLELVSILGQKMTKTSGIIYYVTSSNYRSGTKLCKMIRQSELKIYQ